MYITDLVGNDYPLQATITQELELNGNQSLNMRILPSKVNLTFLNELTELWEITDHDDITYKIVYLKKQGEGNSLSAEIKAIPKIFDDLDTQRIYEEYNQSMTTQYCFNLIFSGSGYNFVLVDTFNAISWEGFGAGDTRLTLFKNALNRYKAEFRISGNTVYLESQIGRDTQFMYRYRLNASNIVQENDASAYWTYAKGYGDYGDGAGGEDWQDAQLIRDYTSPIASIIGKREAPPIKNGNITTTSTMDEQLKTLVDESLKISVSATIHDLRKQGYALAQPEIGDRVFLIDERIGLNEEVRVVDMKVVRDWKGDIKDLSLTFGTPGLVKRHQSNLQTAVSNITQLLEGKKKLPFSVYDNAVQQATKDLQKVTSQLTIPSNGGLRAIDESNPNYIVEFNAAGLGVSDDGGATFKNSITGRGVVAETIYGQSIIGVNLSSINEDGTFHVNGSNAEFINHSNNRSAQISPEGLYGYNSDNSYRFRADGLLVTSRALGTTTANVYLAPDSSNEVRVVDIADVPSDGEIESYSYRPLRAWGIYANFIENNRGATGNNLYIRPRSGGEVRVTGSGTTDAYYPLRAGAIYSNNFVTTSTSLWMGTDSAMHVVNKGYVEDSTGEPIYRNIYASDIWNRSMITMSTHAYIGVDGELRVMNKGLTDVYRPIRAQGLMTGFNNLYLQAPDEVMAVSSGADTWGGNHTYTSFRGSEFNNSSSITYKTNIEDVTVEGLPIINNLEIKQFLYQSDVDKGNYSNWQVGVISELSPEIATMDGMAVNHNKWLGYLTKSQQEEYAARKELEQRVEDLESIIMEGY